MQRTLERLREAESVLRTIRRKPGSYPKAAIEQLEREVGRALVRFFRHDGGKKKVTTFRLALRNVVPLKRSEKA